MSASSPSAIASSRSAADARTGTGTSPQSSTLAPSGDGSRSAYPIPVVPGSMPRITCRSGVLEHLFGHVEVRVHPLDVVEVLERLDEADELAGGIAFDADRVRRAHRELGGGDRDLRRLEGLLHALEGRGRRVDGDET